MNKVMKNRLAVLLMALTLVMGLVIAGLCSSGSDSCTSTGSHSCTST